MIGQHLSCSNGAAHIARQHVVSQSHAQIDIEDLINGQPGSLPSPWVVAGRIQCARNETGTQHGQYRGTESWMEHPLGESGPDRRQDKALVGDEGYRGSCNHPERQAIIVPGSNRETVAIAVLAMTLGQTHNTLMATTPVFDRAVKSL